MFKKFRDKLSEEVNQSHSATGSSNSSEREFTDENDHPSRTNEMSVQQTSKINPVSAEEMGQSQEGTPSVFQISSPALHPTSPSSDGRESVNLFEKHTQDEQLIQFDDVALLPNSKEVTSICAKCREFDNLREELEELRKRKEVETLSLKQQMQVKDTQHEILRKTLEVQLSDTKKEFEALKEEKQKFTSLINSLELQLTESRNRETSLCEEIKRISNGAEEKTEDNSLCERLDSVVSKLKEQEEQCESLTRKCAEYEVSTENLRKEHELMEKKYKDELDMLKDSVAGLQNTLREKDEQILAFKAGNMKLKDELEKQYQNRVASYIQEIQTLKAQAEATKKENEAAVDRLYKQLELREAQLDENLMVAEAQHNSTVKELAATKNQVSNYEEIIKRLETDLDHLKQQEISHLDQIKELKSQLEVKTRDERIIENLQHELEMMGLKIREKEEELESYIDKHHTEEDKIVHQYKRDITALENEIAEKNSALEEVHDYYHQRLQEKEEQLKGLQGELASSSGNEHSYQIKAMQKSLLQYQEENLRLKELVSIRKNAESNKSARSTVQLPEPTEYEYLRNILFEYMMGREPETLAKVIAAVLRFNNEQTEQILRRQELTLANAIRP